MKQFIRKTALALGALAVATGASADPVLSYNGHYYYYATPASSWSAAEAQAVALGGHLVAINDAAEQAALVGAFGGTDTLWIGLTDAASEGTFHWSNGDAVTYTNWNAGEPNNSGNEDFVAMNWGSAGKWNDLPDPGCCTSPLTPLRGIIEVDHELPEPGSLALAALALLGAGTAARRRRG